MDSEKPVTQSQLDAGLKATRDELVARMDRMRDDLSRELGGRMDRMRDDLSRELGGRMDRMRGELSHEMAGMRAALSVELAGHVRAAAEENRQFLAVLDDRYRHLPPRVTLLERELDEHRRDAALHPRRRRK